MSNTVTDNLYRNVSENTKEYFRDVLKLAPYTEPGGLWDSFSAVAERKRQAVTITFVHRPIHIRAPALSAARRL